MTGAPRKPAPGMCRGIAVADRTTVVDRTTGRATDHRRAKHAPAAVGRRWRPHAPPPSRVRLTGLRLCALCEVSQWDPVNVAAERMAGEVGPSRPASLAPAPVGVAILARCGSSVLVPGSPERSRIPSRSCAYAARMHREPQAYNGSASARSRLYQNKHDRNRPGHSRGLRGALTRQRSEGKEVRGRREGTAMRGRFGTRSPRGDR